MDDAQVPADPVGDAPASVEALFRAATAAPTADELIGRDAAVAAFATVPAAARRGRRIAAVTALLVISAGGVAAATGSLPSGLQRAASNLAERVGIELPSPDDHADQDPPGGGTAGRPSDDGTPGTGTIAGPGAPTDSTPAGVIPDEQRLNGWCTAWNRGNAASLDAASRQALTDRAEAAGVDVDTLCEPFDQPAPVITKPQPTTPSKPEPTTPATPQPTTPPRGQDSGQNGGKAP